ncbi:hypothetical protein F1D61_06390 [Methylobacterium aquaticum]|nr:hypothetical protein [Methylobacterium aquaticum]QRE73306.1 hypothetical protein F1D61_06390 [Methylobacterium aquaticum]
MTALGADVDRLHDDHEGSTYGLEIAHDILKIAAGSAEAIDVCDARGVAFAVEIQDVASSALPVTAAPVTFPTRPTPHSAAVRAASQRERSRPVVLTPVVYDKAGQGCSHAL